MSTETGFGVDVATRPDLTSPHFHASCDHASFWRDVRAPVPLRWETPGGRPFWIVTSYDLALRIYKDTSHYTSTKGNMLDTLLGGGDSAAGKMLVVSDGDDHRFMKHVITSIVDEKVRTRLPAQVRAHTMELVEKALARTTCDIAADIADHVPINAISELLDVPREDRDFLHGCASRALSSERPDGNEREAKNAQVQILEYFTELIDQPPPMDGVSFWAELKAASKRGRRLTAAEAVLNSYSLLLGGDETTRLSIAGGIKALTDNPAQWRHLRDRGSIDEAVEEILRWTSPAMHSGRSVVSDHDVEGVVLAARDVVVVWNIAANYDPARFDAPERFDLTRRANRHLSFGYGAHFCLGATLARLEIAAVLEAMLAHVATIEPEGTCERVFSNFTRGYFRVPVRLSAS